LDIVIQLTLCVTVVKLPFSAEGGTMRRFLVPLLSLAVAALWLSLGSSHRSAAQDSSQPESPAAVERARKTVKMLDGVYKTAIVLITDKYVQSKKDYPAGRIAVNWFKAISQDGTHEIRIIDASGEPHGAANVARDDFDKEGIRQIKLGKAFYDQVERKDGKSYLRAMTPVPVVMDKCIMCHDNYKTAKKGEAIGALTYKVLID
jgi:hypothetical protein